MKLSQSISILLLLLSFSFSTLFAQDHDHDDHDKLHPKIGLALSGGGAKGLAHIGVLKVLEEAGIRPDYVTGTSIGSIMGGLYAIGYSVEEMEKMSKELDWNYYFNDELKRTDLPIEERAHADRYQVKLGIENNKVQLPKGFIQGQKIGLLLSYLTFPAHGVKSFDDFPIPFRCIATDLETGEKVILKDGSLAKAMRASMSLPSIFEPMELNGRVLIDGGVVQNLPVEEAFEMGADIVIAVDITSPLYERDGLKSLIQVMAQTSSYKLAEGVAKQKKLADIVIDPAIEGFGTLDFSEVDSLIFLGELAAYEQIEDILKLTHVEHDHIHKHREKKVGFPRVCRVCRVEMSGAKGKRRNTIANVMQMRAVKEYSIEVIESRIKQLFGGQFFKDAYYELTPGADGYELNIDADIKSGEYLQLSMNYDSDTKAAILLNATFRNRGLNGSKFGLDLKLSENPMLAAHYQVYTTSQPNFGVRLSGMLNHYPFYLYNENSEIDKISGMTHYNTRLNLFTSFNNRSLVSIGYGLERYAKRDEYFNPKTEDLGLSQSLLYLQYTFDTFDRQRFPTSGAYLNMESKFSFLRNTDFPVEVEETGITNMNKYIRLEASKIFQANNQFAVRLFADAGIMDFENNAAPDNFLNLFYLGRSLPDVKSHVEFVGLDYMELPATGYWLAGVKFRTTVVNNIYASILLNYAQYRTRIYKTIDDTQVNVMPKSKGSQYGVGLELGFVSPIGPGRMSVEYNIKESNMNYALHLGYLF